LPPSLEDLLEEKELVRVVNRVIEELEPGLVEGSFKGGGCPPYHPRMMLKVLVYACCCKIYSCRNIAKALRRDVTFMWLSGMQRPDFNTVNRFRSEYLQEVLPEVYARTVELLLAEGCIRFEDYFIDGTKMEADASPDATVMLTKDDQLKPAYNIQVASENGFVTGCSVSQKANDGTAFIDHMQQQKALGLPQPERGID